MASRIVKGPDSTFVLIFFIILSTGVVLYRSDALCLPDVLFS